MSRVWSAKERWMLAGGIMFVLLGITWTVLLAMNVHATIENRKTACISRLIDNELYAPQCKPYINEYRSNLEKGNS